ncbi:uncharacterized protein PG998_000171 [Apiospora kogelbergensis]|uniref:uncharacterized protein n=1 Tax=Apiospora kogelbergensis TaxID=1337665 RepID=UPI00312E22C7
MVGLTGRARLAKSTVYRDIAHESAGPSSIVDKDRIIIVDRITKEMIEALANYSNPITKADFQQELGLNIDEGTLSYHDFVANLLDKPHDFNDFEATDENMEDVITAVAVGCKVEVD